MVELRSLRSTHERIRTRKALREELPLIRPSGTFSPLAGRRTRACSRLGDGTTQAICSAPPMYGRSTSGTVIDPSAFW